MTLQTEVSSTEGELPSRAEEAGSGLDDQEELETSAAPSVPDKRVIRYAFTCVEGHGAPVTREGEIEIAKRFERGHLRVLKAISRRPIVTGRPVSWRRP